MKTTPLETNNPHIQLIEPDVERDAAISVGWLEGDLGRDTLRLMGVSAEENKPSSLEQEKERVEGFIANENQLNWMISYDGKIVGSVWADLHSSDELPGPSVHIMIGDPEVRGKGIGTASISAVIDHLRNNKVETIYSRHLLENEGSKHLLVGLGFNDLGEPYTDKDGLKFQNVSLGLVVVEHE
jgi:RimJ/RimL family protein N-acetyltransferase